MLAGSWARLLRGWTETNGGIAYGINERETTFSQITSPAAIRLREPASSCVNHTQASVFSTIGLRRALK
jgi:hypothetical protein